METTGKVDHLLLRATAWSGYGRRSKTGRQELANRAIALAESRLIEEQFNADWLGLWVGIGLFFNGAWILVLS